MESLLTTFAFIAALFALALPASIVFLALRISKTLSITVQAPTALLPDSVQATLNEVNEKLRPAQLPASDEYLFELVRDAVTLAERSKLKGPDRFRIARTHIETRLRAMNVTADMTDVAQRIEAEVAKRRTS